MGCSLEERETTIVWDDKDKLARIWTCSPITIRKLDKLCKELPDLYQCVLVDPSAEAKRYTVPVKYISFRKPINRTMTDEQKQASRERLLKLHEKRIKEALRDT